MNLRDLGEFGFIEKMRSWVSPRDSLVGIGDDAAVVRPRVGASLVATCDALVEGVHFRLDWSSPADVGFKAVSVNVSDLAAMGAEPRWLLLSICAPGATEIEFIEELYRGVSEACGLYGCELIGGDTVGADRIVLAVTALGEVEGDPLLRSGAKPGDVVAVTGPLGKAAAGMNLLLAADPAALEGADAASCVQAHQRPRARVDEGVSLRRAGVHAAIDMSDGLSSDARRLAEASGVGIELDGSRLPIAPEAAHVAEARGWDVTKLVLGGGEDFELLVALPPDAPMDLIEIGRVVEGEGVWLVEDGDRSDVRSLGYDHFREG